MTYYKFFVSGYPVPKQSFIYTKFGGYRNPHVTEWQSLVKAAAMQAGVPVLDGKVKVEVTFYLKDNHRRDLDNLSKGVLDSLNGVAWEDDNQVIDLHVKKFIVDQQSVYQTPGAFVEITEVDKRAK